MVKLTKTSYFASFALFLGLCQATTPALAAQQIAPVRKAQERTQHVPDVNFKHRNSFCGGSCIAYNQQTDKEIGCITYSLAQPYNGSPSALFVDLLVVDKDYRALGLGHQLFLQLKKEALKKEIYIIKGKAQPFDPIGEDSKAEMFKQLRKIYEKYGGTVKQKDAITNETESAFMEYLIPEDERGTYKATRALAPRTTASKL